MRFSSFQRKLILGRNCTISRYKSEANISVSGENKSHKEHLPLTENDGEGEDGNMALYAVSVNITGSVRVLQEYIV